MIKIRLIDADDLENNLREAIRRHHRKRVILALYMMIDIIRNRTTIAVEIVKHGHWEEIKCNTALDKAIFSQVLKCSECGKWKFENVLITKKFHYCPNCGAKMNGGESYEK